MTSITSWTGSESDPLFGANHFTLLRWGLALAVVVGHAWMIPIGYEPLRIHDWTFSYLAVNGFFILSGLLIAKSLATRNDIIAYTQSRILRIYPDNFRVGVKLINARVTKVSSRTAAFYASYSRKTEGGEPDLRIL